MCLRNIPVAGQFTPSFFCRFAYLRDGSLLQTVSVVACPLGAAALCGIASGGIACSALARVEEIHGVLGVGIERELGVAELAGSTGSEAVALYKLGEVPLLDAGGSHLVDDADGEDGKVVNLHCLVLEHELLHTAHHIGEKAFDGTLRERGVVARHVFGEFIDTDGFCYYWSRIILAIRFLDCLVLVLH